ncbi:MAG: hypothetical protein GY707_05560 [Desulfobacteraceae bacterium]|nr:hypothetical protein [Desulfobacteraceae bacterium]
MDIINTISETVTQACIRTDRVIGLEIGVCHDESTSMYGETVYNVLKEGEVDAEFYTIETALEYLDSINDTYI